MSSRIGWRSWPGPGPGSGGGRHYHSRLRQSEPEAHGAQPGPADPDASWTKKNLARDPSQQEWVFGCKAHAVADANHDIPLGIVVTTASRNNSPFLPLLLAKLASGHSKFSLPTGAVVIDDRGYDSRDNNAFVHRNGGVPAIDQRGLPSGKLHNGIYTAEGVPDPFEPA